MTKQRLKLLAIAVIFFTLGAVFVGPAQSTLDKIKKENHSLTLEVTELEEEVASLKEKTEELDSKEYKLFKKMSKEEMRLEEERLDKIEKERKEKEEKARKEEEERLEKARKEEEERLAREEAKAKEEELAKYERTIKYGELKKNPHKYTGEHYKFRGKIVQIMESGNKTVIRLSVVQESYGWSINDIVYVAYRGTTDFVDGDVITVYGTVQGDHTYQSQAGYYITLPLVEAKEFAQ